MDSCPKALFLGEILVDIIFRRSKSESYLEPTAISPGGSIFNSAVILSRLGVKAGLFSKFENDEFGDYLNNFLKKENIESFQINSSLKLKTPIAIAVIDKNGKAKYSFYKDDFRIMPHFNNKLFKKAKIAHFGSVFSYSDNTYEVAAEFSRIAKKNNLKIFYDPNIRPQIIKNFKDAKKRIIRFFKLADIIKLSKDDLRILSNSNNVNSSLSWLKHKTNAVTILTLGRNGALAIDNKNRFIKVPSFKVKISDTIGAGDAFSAGLIYKFCLSGNFENFLADIKKHLIFSSAVSAIICKSFGALNGLKSLEDVEKFLKSHTLRK